VTPEIRGTLRAVAIGSAIGVVVAFVGVAGALLGTGHQASVALGVGGMAAFWGGLGFGSMLGGTMHLVRHGDDDAAQRPSASPAPSPRARYVDRTA
jgi:hypothetical protein